MLIQNLFKQKTTNSSQQLNSWIQNEDKNITAKYRHEYKKEGEWYDSSEIWSSKNRSRRGTWNIPRRRHLLYVNIKFTTKILPKVFNLRYTTNAIYSSNILCLPSASIQQKRHLIKYAFLFLFPILYTFDIVVLCIENKW